MRLDKFDLAFGALLSAQAVDNRKPNPSNDTSVQPVPSLLQLRDVLASYQSAIIHSVLSRSVFSATPVLAQEEQDQVRYLLAEAVKTDSDSTFPSITSTVPSSVFCDDGSDTLPYLSYGRNASIGRAFGDDAAGYEPSVFNYTFSTLFPANDSVVITPLTHSLPLSSTTFSLLSLVSARISNGVAVALAKLYDAKAAKAAPTNTTTAPSSTVCGFLKSGDQESVRGFLTDLKQVASVRQSVTAQTQAWLNMTGAPSAVDLVPRVVGLFDV